MPVDANRAIERYEQVRQFHSPTGLSLHYIRSAKSSKEDIGAPSGSLSKASLFVHPALLGRHQGRLFEDIGRQRLLRDERQLPMKTDPVDNRELGQEGHALHPPAAAETDHRVHLVDL